MTNFSHADAFRDPNESAWRAAQRDEASERADINRTGPHDEATIQIRLRARAMRRGLAELRRRGIQPQHHIGRADRLRQYRADRVGSGGRR